MKQKLSVMIGDPCDETRSRLQEWLEQTRLIRVIDCHSDARPIASSIPHVRPDALILDSKLPPVGAFRLSEAIEPGLRPRLIIISDDAEDAVRAFEIRAFDFIRKPLTRESVSTAILRTHSSMLLEGQELRSHRRIAVRHGARTLLIRLDEIDWIEAAGNYVRIHAGADSWLLRETMSGIDTKLPPGQFVRIQRSVIVNLDRVDALQNGKKDDLTVLLSDATELPLSRTYREGFELALGM